jgi:hypothetical protein
MATAALIAGVATVVIPILAIAGVALGIVSLRRIRLRPWIGGKGRSIAGIVTSMALLPIGIAIFIPTFLSVSPAHHPSTPGRTGAVLGTSPAQSFTPPTSGMDTQSVLDAAALNQSDVPSGYKVLLFNGGDEVAGQVTLDFCGANYPSEALRVARHQVGLTDSSGQDLLFSTEAVAYTSSAATAQAFSELRSAAADCPDTFVASPVQGEPPLKTVVLPPPDTAWPNVSGVGRLTLEATVSDQQGQSQTSLAVYLRHGSILLGVYFDDLSNIVPIDGRTTPEGIVTLFEQRLAALPANPTS